MRNSILMLVLLVGFSSCQKDVDYVNGFEATEVPLIEVLPNYDLLNIPTISPEDLEGFTLGIDLGTELLLQGTFVNKDTENGVLTTITLQGESFTYSTMIAGGEVIALYEGTFVSGTAGVDNEINVLGLTYEVVIGDNQGSEVNTLISFNFVGSNNDLQVFYATFTRQ